MSKKDEKKESITAESWLGPQFGSDPVIMAQGEYDNLILSKIHPVEPACMAYFLRKKSHRGGRFWRALIMDMLKLKRSEEGWGQNKTIQFTAAAKGSPSVGEIVKRPGWIARHTTKRGFDKKAREEGKTVIE